MSAQLLAGGRDCGEPWSVPTPPPTPLKVAFIGTRHLAVRIAAWQGSWGCMAPAQWLRSSISREAGAISGEIVLKCTEW